MAPPKQKPHRSKQNYATPKDFLRATRGFLGIDQFTFDFAAERRTRTTPRFWSKDDDSLSMSRKQWRQAAGEGWGWLNPPYTAIGLWAERCLQLADDGGSVAFLVPAGVGSNWYRDFVHQKALVLALNGRLCFIENWRKTVDPSPRNKTGAYYTSEPLYPKDCILALYGPQFTPDFDVWTWK